MPFNPVETLNVFDKDLRAELRERSKSVNLVRTRAPFIRLSTGAKMGELTKKLNEMATNNPSINLGFDNGKLAAEYSNCSFFTLGLHGWNNLNYSAEDLYGTKGNKGLVVGTTYSQGTQKLVYAIKQSAAKNHPPRGITSAKVERLRNGNVLRFTVETQCYTQEQLEMLDLLCYVPGMTCILEWGSVANTADGVQGLKTLDFKNVEQTKLDVYLATQQSRKSFVDKWCAPNKFNYDWAVANIANIKTRLENNVYKTTIIAYGKADNIMYVSAYATNNPLTETAFIQGQNINKSVQEYFRFNGTFSALLRNIIATPDAYPEYRGKVFRFNDPIERKNIQNLLPAAQQFGTANDIGLEDAYFISLEAFIDLFLNRDVLNILNSALSISNRLNKLVAPLRLGQDTDIIYAGYNKYLRSTSPDVMIIYNKQAIDVANATVDRTRDEVLNSVLTSPTGSFVRNFFDRARGTDSSVLNTEYIGSKLTEIQPYLTNKPFGQNTALESDVMPLHDGVWINSKAVQQAFINARTIFEGLEALLNRINAATENYWDLSLFYDDDIPGFRILDSNCRKPDIKEKIYEFNKPLTSLDNAVIGPDVLDIKIESDYPKLLFSQLAISAINNGVIVSDAQRRDLDFRKGSSVLDIFADDAVRPAEVQVVESTASGVGQTATVAQNLARIINSVASPRLTTLDQPLAKDTNVRIREQDVAAEIQSRLTTGFGTDIPTSVVNFLVKVFAVPGLLDVNTSLQFKQELNTIVIQEKLPTSKVAAIKQLLLLRSRQIIIANKRKEIDNLVEAYENFKKTSNAINAIGVMSDITERTVLSDIPRNEIIQRIRDDGNKLIRELYLSAGVEVPTFIAAPQGLGTITLNVTI